MKDFSGKTAVITGAGSGLGRSFALQLFQAGAHLALCDLDWEGLDETLHLTGDDGKKVRIFQVDVSDQAVVEAFAREVGSLLGPADLLINNAGICLVPQPFNEISDDLFRKVLDVNLWGAYYGIRAFLPQLESRPEAAIVNVSSLAGMIGLYRHSAYSMSKSGLRGLTEALQSELAGSPVQLTIAYPGGVKTNLIKNAPNLESGLREKAHRNFTKMSFLSPDKTTARILKAVQKKRNRIIIGGDAWLILAIRALFPRRHPRLIQTFFSQASFKEDPTWRKNPEEA
jgi:butyryl-CoA dehydrogenase